MNFEKICKQVKEITIDTGFYIKKQIHLLKQHQVESKGTHDFVTFVDKTAEKKLVKSLSQILPEAGFIAEENTSNKRGDKYNWIVDPLDGTTNFIHGLSPYAISIALKQDDKIVLGVVYEISLNECFFAWENSKAFLNNNEICVTQTNKINNSLIATGFPYYDYKRLNLFLNSLEYLMKNSHGIRRLGSAATDLAYVACGRFDAFYEYSLHAWDVAAGAFIVQQAGGLVCDFKGKDNYLFGGEIIATNLLLHNSFRNVVSDFMCNKK
ncbi:MAG: inositol monophosphatase [Chlorobi bacterium]|nr:inositol monophosphatase [Chlorobiota bacterium]